MESIYALLRALVRVFLRTGGARQIVYPAGPTTLEERRSANMALYLEIRQEVEERAAHRAAREHSADEHLGRRLSSIAQEPYTVGQFSPCLARSGPYPTPTGPGPYTPSPVDDVPSRETWAHPSTTPDQFAYPTHVPQFGGGSRLVITWLVALSVAAALCMASVSFAVFVLLLTAVACARYMSGRRGNAASRGPLRA
ncbi:hypothetical protein [Streptomyces sp. NPDC050564]|uniref:hypothetical protein n=1 Tax=Streptomyces sp. NPDC050564 TaxID=3365631 RepID=UPI0037A5E8D9